MNATIRVQYREGCGTGRKFVITYTNQVVVSGSGFSAGGDSGSLIVTNDREHHPVGLLFAGSSTVTVANPIDEVLSRVGAALGGPVSFDLSRRGGGQPGATTTDLAPDEIARGTRAKEAHGAALLSESAVLGVGVGEDLDERGRAAVVVFVQRGSRVAIARQLDGVRTRVIETDPILAFGWNEPAGTSCQAR